MTTARKVDKTLLLVTLASAPIVAVVTWLLLAWPLAAFTVLCVYGLALVSGGYRLTAFFKERNPIEHFIIREHGQLRISSLGGLFDMRSDWQTIPLSQITQVAVREHGVEVHTAAEVYVCSVVGERDDLYDYMRAVLADTSVEVLKE